MEITSCKTQSHPAIALYSVIKIKRSYNAKFKKLTTVIILKKLATFVARCGQIMLIKSLITIAIRILA